MAENDPAYEPVPPRPVGLVPTSVVDALVAENQADFEKLRAELASLLRDAERIENRIREAHPVALMYDHGLAAAVERYVADWLGASGSVRAPAAIPAGEDRSLPAEGRLDPPAPPPSPVATFGNGPWTPRFSAAPPLYTDAAEGGGSDTSAIDRVESASRPPFPAEDEATTARWSERGSHREVVTPPAGVPVGSPSTDRPRTTVVDRNTAPAAAAPQLPPIEDSPVEARPAAEEASPDWTIAPATAKSGHWTQRLPSRLLIELGIVVVIVGLVLLKLG